MHQSIPDKPCPPLPRAKSLDMTFLFLWMTNSRVCWHLSCQIPGGRDVSRGQMPRYIHNKPSAAGSKTRSFVHAQGSRFDEITQIN